MGKSRKTPIIRNQQGQAVLEYMLMLSVALAVVTTLSIGFKQSLFTIWGIFSKEISAPCPSCVPDPKVQFRN
jgi:Flp pilus assembly pilin Flp